MNKTKLVALVAAVVIIVTSGCVPLDPQSSAPTKTQSELFDEYLNEMFIESVNTSLIDIHFTLTEPEKYGLTNYTKTLGGINFDLLDNPDEHLQKSIDELAAFDRSQLTEEQQVIYDIFQYENEASKNSLSFSYYNDKMSPLLGIQSELLTLFVEYRFDDAQDAYDYIEMLNSTSDYFDDLLEYQRRRSERGLFCSDAVIDKTLKSLDNFINEGEQNILITNFEERLDTLGDALSSGQRTELIESNRNAVLQSLIPSYKQLRDGVAELKGTGVNEGGLCFLPNGKEYYEYMVKSTTGSSWDVELMAEKIEEEIEKRFEELYRLLIEDRNLLERASEYTETDRDPEKTIEQLIERMGPMMPEIKEIDYTVKYVPTSREENSSPAFYITPPIDRHINSIYINRKYIDNYVTLFSLMAHEGYPGHMYQYNYFAQTNPHPIRNMMSYSGYSEGWANYVEEISFHFSNINDYNVERVIAIDDKISFLVSTRADIGIHYEGWDKEDLRKLLQKYNFNDGDNVVNDLYDTIIEEPGNFMIYCIGSMEINDMRDYAESELGNAFDEVEFHRAILDIGAAPFEIVRRSVEDYVKSAKAADYRNAA